jgi:4-aminobutyrate aminotransferase/(S)-3-amino-2-methylpropionate transaminase
MSTTNQDLLARRTKVVPRGVSNATAIYTQRAQNAEMWDVEGRRYIDFAAGIAVLNTGHNHPRVVAAVTEQLTRFSHTAFQVTPYETYIALAERLNALVPGPTPKKTLLVTTGAEATENAVKIARAYTKRPAIIAFVGGFHGRTMMGMALTGKVVPYKTGFGPFPGDVHHLPYPMAYHDVSEQDALDALERLFKADVDPASVAAIILEPVQGEGGFYIAPFGFLKALRKICDQHGILLVLDEVQTGFARTGTVFAHEQAGVEADLVPMAKSLAGGFPLAAVTGKAEIMDAPGPGGLGGTYGGSPIACAAAHAVLDVIEDEGLCARAVTIGQRFTDRLLAMQNDPRFGCIGEVRGLGAMVAIELVKDRNPHKPDADLTKALVARAAEKGLILLSCGLYSNVIRFLVPLTASDALIDEGLDVLQASLAEVVA